MLKEKLFRLSVDPKEEEKKKSNFCNVILYEICENVHIHSRANIGLMSIRILPKNNPQQRETYMKSAHLAPFLKDSPKTDFFEIGIVDSGVGIYNTLGTKLEELYDWNYKERDELEVLKQAFEKHDFDRDGVLTEELFDVREAVKEWKGFISLRSGHSRLSYIYTEKKC